MEMPDEKRCPVCGSPHDTYSGVGMHMVKMDDEAHDHINGMDEAYEQLAYSDVIPARNHARSNCPYYADDAPVAD